MLYLERQERHDSVSSHNFIISLPYSVFCCRLRIEPFNEDILFDFEISNPVQEYEECYDDEDDSNGGLKAFRLLPLLPIPHNNFL